MCEKKVMTIPKKYCIIQKLFVPLHQIGNGASHHLIITYNTMKETEKLTEKTMEQTMKNTSDALQQTDAEETDELLIVKQFLGENYEFRNNVVSGKLEFRKLEESDETFRQLTFEAENSIIVRAMSMLGKVKGLKTNLTLLIHSEEVPVYDPVREYLTTLPRWDGQNRVAELFSRLPGITSENIYRCTIWLRSAVAHWLKLDLLHGNDSVPTLIGDQGCGKTVFCRRMLPPALQDFFLDRVNLSNKFDKDMALSNNMIVVLDEFDQYTKGQQAILKQAISKSTVNARPIFKGAQVLRHRYASFLATTNNLHPLNDPTGSRRYLCIRLTPGALIDNTLDIDYDQLYAQLVEEVCEQKMRYWFTPEETRQIQIDNVPFQNTIDIDEMVDACFAKPKAEDEAHEYSMSEIVELIAMQYPYVECSSSMKMRVGGMLRKKGYAVHHRRNGNYYVLVPKKAA